MFYRNITKNTFNTLLNWNNYVPPEISGLQLWLDASQLGLANNDPVGSWTDLSGNSNHATQSNLNYKPLFKTNIQNGLPSVLFDGSDDRMSFGSQLASIDNLSSFLVAKYLSSADQSALSSADENRWYSRILSGNFNVRVGAGTINCGTADTNCHIFETKHTGGVATAYIDKASKGTVNDNNTSATIDLTVGCYKKDPTFNGFFNGYFFELIFCTTPSEANRNLLYSYLSSKWGITIA